MQSVDAMAQPWTVILANITHTTPCFSMLYL